MTIPVGFGQATILMSGNGLPTGGAVVLGFENELGSSAQAAADAYGEAWRDQVMPLLTDDVTLDEVVVKLGPDDVGPTASSAYSTAGTIVTENTPPNTAYLVKKTSNLGGRRGRGRIYIPGVDETKVTSDGRLEATKLGQLQTAMDAFEGEVALAGFPLMILHNPATIWVLEDGQPRREPTADPIPVPTPVLDLIVQSTVATQRRRLRR